MPGGQPRLRAAARDARRDRRLGATRSRSRGATPTATAFRGPHSVRRARPSSTDVQRTVRSHRRESALRPSRSHAATLSPDVRDHEPALALFGRGDDGLDDVRELLAQAASRLAPSGRLMMEFGFGQGSRAAGAERRWPRTRRRPEGPARPRAHAGGRASHRRARHYNSHMSCLFCRIIAGEIPSSKVFEDADLFAFNDINPQAPLHVLIVPREAHCDHQRPDGRGRGARRKARRGARRRLRKRKATTSAVTGRC